MSLPGSRMTDQETDVLIDMLCELFDDLKREAYEMWLYGPRLVQALATAYPEEDV